jgi:beta-barrel assembly-enhancing protease
MKNVLAAIALYMGTALNASPNASEIATYRALVAQDLRLASVGYQLAAANAPYCKARSHNPGLVLHDVAQYPDRATAIAAFSFPEPVSVAAVVKDGPADRAGVKTGDGLAAIGGKDLDIKIKEKKQPTYARLAKVKDILENALRSLGGAVLTLNRGSGKVTAEVVPSSICASEFWVDSKTALDAGADGSGVRVTAAMMDYIADDSELAAVVAHELAHNLLGHRARLSRLGEGKSRATLKTEIEADRLSVWLMRNAGYDPHAAIRFWQRYGPKTSMGIFSDATHLRWANRIELLEAEIEKMAQSGKRDGPLPPPLLVGG